ncbi:MAG: DUF4397 domain-containing protein [Agrococcus sp.]
MKGKLAIGAGAALAIVALGGAPATASTQEATVSVLHLIPETTVDAYIDGTEVIGGFEPGELSDPMTLVAGSYDVELYAEGEGPGDAEPVARASGVEVTAGVNLTIAGHLSESGEPTLTAFPIDTDPVPAGQGRLTLRHLAAVPGADIRADGAVIVQGLRNSQEASLVVPAGTVSADLVRADTQGVGVLVPPTDLEVAEGVNTIVTAWGSEDQETLQLAVQVVEAHSAPRGVPSGIGGAATPGALGLLLAIGGAVWLAAIGARATRGAEAHR